MRQIDRDKILKSLSELREKIFNKEVEYVDLQSLLTVTLQWFEYYQGKQDYWKMVDLYKKLIKEELSEISDAWVNKDMVALLDWYVDYLWVQIWYIWFYINKNNENTISDNKEQIILEEVTKEFNLALDKIIIPAGLFTLAWLEVAYSNWTKSLELRDENDEEGKVGKVIKGKDYKEPELDKIFKVVQEMNKTKQ